MVQDFRVSRELAVASSTWVVILWPNWTFQPVIQPTTIIGGGECNTHSPSKIQFFTQAHALFLGKKALLGRHR